MIPSFWRRFPASWQPTLLRLGLNWFPAYRATGARIIDVSPVIEAKLAALQAHASQIDASNPLAYLTPATASPLAVEHFHLLETSPAHRSALDLLTVAPRGERAGLARY